MYLLVVHCDDIFINKKISKISYIHVKLMLMKTLKKPIFNL